MKRAERPWLKPLADHRRCVNTDAADPANTVCQTVQLTPHQTKHRDKIFGKGKPFFFSPTMQYKVKNTDTLTDMRRKLTFSFCLLYFFKQTNKKTNKQKIPKNHIPKEQIQTMIVRKPFVNLVSSVKNTRLTSMFLHIHSMYLQHK